MVHGDVREEQDVLDARGRGRSPDFFRIYLGDGALDREELAWLHDRRLRDLELADRILVPSEHIAETLVAHGTPRDEDPRRSPTRPTPAGSAPIPASGTTRRCTFLFAGGITQRKGIKYLLEAWRRVRRPGLAAPAPRCPAARPGPARGYLDEVEHLGRVAHAEMPARMAAADVFVFPSLFEGSAVVTYEALACGLPSIVTPDAGSVVRDGVEGFVVPPGDVEAPGRAHGAGSANDPALRAAMAVAARTRAEAFDWPRYHAAVDRSRAASVIRLMESRPRPRRGSTMDDLNYVFAHGRRHARLLRMSRS